MSAVKKYNSKRKLRRIEIEPMDDGGFVTHTYHDTQDDLGKGANIYSEGNGHEKVAHTSASSALRHIKPHMERHAAHAMLKGDM